MQVKYFLDNWSAIRASDAMRNVWQQIRLGRHPGYEEGRHLLFQTLWTAVNPISFHSLAVDRPESGIQTTTRHDLRGRI